MPTAQQTLDLNKLLRQMNPNNPELEEYITLINSLYKTHAPNSLADIGGLEVNTTTADFVKNQSTTLQSVPGLKTEQLAINTKYRIEMTLLVSAPGVVPDMKFRFVPMAGGTFKWLFTFETNTSAVRVGNVSYLFTIPGIVSMAKIIGILEVGGTIGALDFEMAQNVSANEDSIVRVNSTMKTTRIL